MTETEKIAKVVYDLLRTRADDASDYVRETEQLDAVQIDAEVNLIEIVELVLKEAAKRKPGGY